ncbi:hypothetical protein L0F63_006000 [Massospora cicadina]|nr:hypothetical protein L0F63_006000 [Massospora cicadina]
MITQLDGLRLTYKALLAKVCPILSIRSPGRVYSTPAGSIEGDAPVYRYGPRRPHIDYELQAVKSVPQRPYDPYQSRRTGVIAKKKGMTCLWDNLGNQVPCTVVQVEDCQVTFVKTLEKDGYSALQVGAVNVAQHKLTRSVLGHFVANGVAPKRRLVEFRVSEDAVLPIGLEEFFGRVPLRPLDFTFKMGVGFGSNGNIGCPFTREPLGVRTQLSAAHLCLGNTWTRAPPGEADPRGKGFQGGMKRHGFAGLPASHGVSISHRSIGSTGQRAQPGKVFKGKKMPGRMGVVKIDVDLNLVYLKGCIPGHNEQYVTLVDAVRKPGLAKFGAPRAEAFQPTSGTFNPPFPTFDPAELSSFPREVMARLGKPPAQPAEANEK